MARNARISRRTTTTIHLGRTGRRFGALAAAGVVAAAAVFALGLALGRGGEARQASPEPPVDRLTLLDGVERIAPPAPPPASLEFHDALTKDRPHDTFPKVAPVRHAPPAGSAPAKPAAAPAPPVHHAPAPDAPVAVTATTTTGKGTATTTLVAVVPAAGAEKAAATTANKTATQPATANKTPTATANKTATPTPAQTSVRPATAPAGWSVQLLSSPNEGEAKRLASRHAGARVVPADVDGQRWYRVRLQGFASREDARAALERLGRAGARAIVVR